MSNEGIHLCANEIWSDLENGELLLEVSRFQISVFHSGSGSGAGIGSTSGADSKEEAETAIPSPDHGPES